MDVRHSLSAEWMGTRSHWMRSLPFLGFAVFWIFMWLCRLLSVIWLLFIQVWIAFLCTEIVLSCSLFDLLLILSNIKNLSVMDCGRYLEIKYARWYICVKTIANLVILIIPFQRSDPNPNRIFIAIPLSLVHRQYHVLMQGFQSVKQC